MTSSAASPVKAGRLVTAAEGGWSAPSVPVSPAATGPASDHSPDARPADSPASPTHPVPEAVVSPAVSRPATGPPQPPPAPSGPPPGYTSARLTRPVDPHYPREARKKGQAGTVHLTLQVRPDGRVEKVTVSESSGFPLLDEAAVAAARSWRYEPARNQGRPVGETKQVAVVFRLED